jgi:hypothetical protein
MANIAGAVAHFKAALAGFASIRVQHLVMHNRQGRVKKQISFCGGGFTLYTAQADSTLPKV